MKGNNDPQQALNLALHQLAVDFGELTKDLNKRIALVAVAMAESGCFVPREPCEQTFHGTYDDGIESAARIHKDYTVKTARKLFCIYCNRPIDACTCADAIEAEYTDVTPTNFPQLSAPKDRGDE